MQRLKPRLMERACERYLAEVRDKSGTPGVDAYKRYLDVYQFIQAKDREFGLAFNDWRRSRAFERLAHIRMRKFLTEEEFSQFSPETRGVVDLLLGLVD